LIVTPSEKKIIIRIKNLGKKFQLKDTPLFAIENISLDIEENTIVGFIGRSGAGKSTLLRCVNRLETPDTGEVWYHNLQINTASEKDLRKVRHEIGMIFQHFNLLARRTVLENVCLPLEIAGKKNKKGIRAKAMECLQLVGLQDHIHAYPAELSGGQKQRVAIARALAGEAKVLLCDEATSALDPETTQEILQLLLSLKQKLRLTVILITHEVAIVKEVCDFVYVLDKGKIIEAAPTEIIFSKPQHEITRTFVDSLISKNVPDFIRQNMQTVRPSPSTPSDVIIQLIFSGHIAEEPIISQFLHQSSHNINILAGHLDHIGKSSFGALIVSLPNTSAILQEAQTFLESKGVQIKILGYIPK